MNTLEQRHYLTLILIISILAAQGLLKDIPHARLLPFATLQITNNQPPIIQGSRNPKINTNTALKTTTLSIQTSTQHASRRPPDSHSSHGPLRPTTNKKYARRPRQSSHALSPHFPSSRHQPLPNPRHSLPRSILPNPRRRQQRLPAPWFPRAAGSGPQPSQQQTRSAAGARTQHSQTTQPARQGTTSRTRDQQHRYHRQQHARNQRHYPRAQNRDVERGVAEKPAEKPRSWVEKVKNVKGWNQRLVGLVAVVVLIALPLVVVFALYV